MTAEERVNTFWQEADSAFIVDRDRIVTVTAPSPSARKAPTSPLRRER